MYKCRVAFRLFLIIYFRQYCVVFPAVTSESTADLRGNIQLIHRFAVQISE